MNSDEARPYTEPLQDFYNRITDLVSEMQQRRVVRKATIDCRDEICRVHDKDLSRSGTCCSRRRIG